MALILYRQNSADTDSSIDIGASLMLVVTCMRVIIVRVRYMHTRLSVSGVCVFLRVDISTFMLTYVTTKIV